MIQHARDTCISRQRNEAQNQTWAGMDWVWDYFDSLTEFGRRSQFLLDMLTLFRRCALLELIGKTSRFWCTFEAGTRRVFEAMRLEKGAFGCKRRFEICWFTMLPPLPPSVIIQPFDDSWDCWWYLMSFCDCERIGSSAYRKGSKSRYHKQLSDSYSSNQTHLQCKVSAPIWWNLKEERVSENNNALRWRRLRHRQRSHGDDSPHIGPDSAMPWLQAWDRCTLQLMWRTTKVTRSNATT